MPAETLECFLSSQKRLAICFEQAGNLWTEQWRIGDAPPEKLLLNLVSSVGAKWPSSPPWQEVIRESHGGIPVILAIGRAGQSHWSGSWKVLKAGVVAVEYACRVQREPEFMGVTYQLAPGASCVQVADNCLKLAIEGNALRISAGIETSINVEDDGLIRIQPNNDGSGSLPRTLRWGYRAD